MAKRSSSFKLIIMIVVAVALFMGLALGEDYARGFITRWQNRGAAATAATAVGKTIEKYNQTLVKAYEQEKPSLLSPVATERQITDVRLYMTYDKVEKKRKMSVELKSLLIDKIKKKGAKATALTTETWVYNFKDLNTGKESGRAVESYRVTYNLKKTGGLWLVDSLKAKKI